MFNLKAWTTIVQKNIISNRKQSVDQLFRVPNKQLNLKWFKAISVIKTVLDNKNFLVHFVSVNILPTNKLFWEYFFYFLNHFSACFAKSMATSALAGIVSFIQKELSKKSYLQISDMKSIIHRSLEKNILYSNSCDLCYLDLFNNT